jgi:Cu2+-exporting ATPase
MGECDLCALPTGDNPVTLDDVSGEFCCRGCLEVSRTLADRDDVDPAATAPAESAADSTESVAARLGDERIPEDADEAYLAVDGMHCTTCETFLDLRGDDIDGVYAVDANYAMETARVHYDPAQIEESALPDLLSGRGYRLRFRDTDHDGVSHEQTRRRRKTLQRLIVGGFFSMLIMPWYFFYLYPSYVGVETVFLDAGASSGPEIYIPLAVLGLLTTLVLLYTGFPILRGAAVSIRTRQPNMDLLISVAALAAYGYSTLAFATGSTHLYYDVTVVVIMVVTLGRYYEDRSRSRATERLSAVTAARVTEATQLTDDGRETVSRDALAPGDELIVSPGERIPVDGTVADGVAPVDESLLTGESMPETKRPGDAVIGGSVVTDDALVVEVGTAVESTADRIATTLWEIQSATPGVQRFADALATIFVPLVLVLAAVVTAWQFLTGGTVAAAMLAGLTVLVVSCPCAMGLATPLAISAGLRDALDHGVVVTNESVFETAPPAETVVFDKTGTLTAGEMAVDEVTGDEDTLRRAAAVERFASHPVADAILDGIPAHESDEAADWNSPTATDGGVASSREGPRPSPAEQTDSLPRATGFTRHAGAGVEASVDGSRTVVGTPDLLEREFGPLATALADTVEQIETDGGLPVVVGWDGQARGVVAVTDRERAGWREALSAFADHRVVILTGDEGPGAERFRDHPAVDDVFAGVPPDGKVETVRRLGRSETTVMVGDGTNDAPALAEADLGIAVGDATARATSGADVVVTAAQLTVVDRVFDLAAGTRSRIRQNVAWALCYNAVAVPLAVAGLINPLFAALAMATSSILVVSNSRRSVVR